MSRPTRMPCGDRIFYGADYNPDQWLDAGSVLSEDIDLMRAVGATSVSVGIFSWTALEPAPGEYRFGWLDEVMDRLGAAGLSVFLATPSGSKPMWLSDGHPEVRRVGPDGRRDPSGGRHNHCPTSPVYREAVARINRELAARYGDHAALALWHVGNELSGECHCDLCRTAFHAWLQRRYGTLDVLNRAWWTAFWNHTFTCWSQVPTSDKSIDGLAVDWLRFINEQHVSFLENEMAPLRELAPSVPCTTNFMGANRQTNYWLWAGSLDCISNDLYPLHDDREGSWRKSLGADFIHSLMRGLAGGDPWILMECSPSSVNWARVNKLKRPGVHMQEVLQAVANGADVIHYFQWRKGRGGFEKFHGAVVDHEGSRNTRVFRECAEVGRALESLGGVTGIPQDRAPVGLVYDWESRWALSASAGPKHGDGPAASGDRYTQACVEHFRALRCAGLEVDVISLEADFSKYRMVVTPALFMIAPGAGRRLADYAEAGGFWAATYLTGYVDASNRCWLGGFPGPGLREVFGLWNEEVDYLFDDETVRIRGAVCGPEAETTATDIFERLHAEGARTLAIADSELYAGNPVILRNDWGAGGTAYLGARIAEDGCIAFYGSLADDLGLRRDVLPKGIVRKVRVGADGPVEFLFNYTRHDVAVDLGSARFLSMSDHASISGKAMLRPYETLIRRAAAPAPSPFDHQSTPTLRHKTYDAPIPTQS